MSLSRPCGAAAMIVALAAAFVVPARAQSAPVVRDLAETPADARIRHSGRQGGLNSPEWFGREMATGDFNNDGRQDLAVSADFDAVRGDVEPGRGFVYVYFGRGDALPAEIDDAERAADCRIYGEKYLGQFGTELAVADFDGDGHDDLAVSAIESYTINWGNVFIVSGADMAANPELRMDEGQFITHIKGRKANAENGILLLFGFGLTAGDFNGDGLGDLAVAAIGGDGPDGRRDESGDVCVWLGRRSWPRDLTGELAGCDLYLLGRRAFIRMGAELAAGDLDGDGRDELAVANFATDGPDDQRSLAGDVSIFAFGAGSPLPLPGSAGEQPARILWDTAYRAPSGIVHGPIVGSRIGSSASDGGGRGIAVGDFDGDGVDDMLVGAPFYGPSAPNAKNTGALFVVWGDEGLTSGATVDLASPGGAATFLALGEPGVSLGDTVLLADIDGDGRDDAVAGAPDFADATGYVALYGGRPRPDAAHDGPLVAAPDAVVRGATPLWRFGDSAVALDSTFAGAPLLAVGAPNGGFFPFGGRGYAGEVDVVLAAPLAAAFPKFPSIDVTGATVVAPGATATLQIEVDSPSGAAVALSAPDLPAFASLRTVDADAGLYELRLAPSAGDRGRREVLLVATDAAGAEARRRVPVAVGFAPAIASVKLKQISGRTYRLTINGSGFSAGDAKVFVDGQELTPVKYPAKFSSDGGATVRRVTVKSGLISVVVEPGQTSFVTVVNPAEGLSSEAHPLSR